MSGYPRAPGPLGPPPAVYRFPRSGGGFRRVGRAWRWIAAFLALILLFVVLDVAIGIYANWLWFGSVGYHSIYATRITTRTWLFFAGAGLFLAIFLSNIFIARRLAPAADDPSYRLSPEWGQFIAELPLKIVGRAITAAAILVAAGISIIFGVTAAGHWEDVLLILHSQAFGVSDPQFHKDLGFYVFKLPVYRFALDWVMAAVIVTIIGTVVAYGSRAALHGFRLAVSGATRRRIFRFDIARPIKLHLSILVAALLLIVALRYYLDIFGLVYSTRGVELGAFYTDVHASLPFYYVLMAMATLTAALVLVGVYRGGLVLPLGAVGAWILVAIAGAIYPLLVQAFVVQPNEISREEKYLARNIEMTRYAYGLDQVDEQQFTANPQASEQEVNANQDTLNNVRLWDPSPLRQDLLQIQTIRPLFEFLDVDVDRYTIDGKYRQVMLSARELNPGKLPADAQTWVNRRLQFTHGYGFTVAAVNEAQPDGTPSLLVSDIPLQGPLTTDRPEIYFGEEPDHYIIVDGNEPEFTPVGGGENVQTRFEGGGGVGLGNIFRRIVYAWELGDRNILISGAINSNSRVIYRRNIQQRIHEIAPFLKLDADPYIVVDQGNIYWMQDAYTSTDRIPYSHRTGGVNYIRNSVKVVVNAYSGETTFYAMQPDEPLLKAYSKVFPHLFRPAADMPAVLRQHIRYPEDMFRLQTQAYLRYHIRDARQFYQKEDQWDVPTEKFGTQDQPVRPYYVVARLPGGQSEEFMLIMPFVPLNRTNAIAWLAARSDGDNYGKLVAFRFPSTESVPGPTQIENRIDSDGRVSQQLTLWNQSGSTVNRGNLLMIPIGSANLFFEPLYLEASGTVNTIPQLKRVVVVNGDNIAMEPTLSRAIDVLFGRAAPSGLESTGATATTPGATPAAGTPSPAATTAAQATPAPTSAPPPAGDAASLAAQAQDSYNRAQQLLRNGDFAGYGAETARLKQILDQLQQVLGTPTATP